MRKVKITNIRRGKGIREKIIYAHIEDATDGTMLVSSSLRYCMEVVNTPWREVELINAQEVASIVAELVGDKL
jgi:hypothetical protein